MLRGKSTPRHLKIPQDTPDDDSTLILHFQESRRLSHNNRDVVDFAAFVLLLSDRFLQDFLLPDVKEVERNASTIG